MKLKLDKQSRNQALNGKIYLWWQNLQVGLVAMDMIGVYKHFMKVLKSEYGTGCRSSKGKHVQLLYL